MKRIGRVLALILLVCIVTLTGCDAFESITGGGTNAEEFNKELASATGCWRLVGDEDTYFTFDGSKDVMSFSYTEDGAVKYSGTFRAVYRGNAPDIPTPLTLVLQRDDRENEDAIGCYTEGFEEQFTQFTVMKEEEDLGMISGALYTHVYRISEIPYKMGTYVLEGQEYREESDDYGDADSLHIPNGTYALESGESFTFRMTKPTSRELFQYRNGDTLVEGTFWIAADQKTIYLYIEHDPYSKVTPADREHYDTTFDIYYPPDFYLRGDFSEAECFIVNGLYRHGETPSELSDEVWVFGTYERQ